MIRCARCFRPTGAAAALGIYIATPILLNEVVDTEIQIYSLVLVLFVPIALNLESFGAFIDSTRGWMDLLHPSRLLDFDINTTSTVCYSWNLGGS